MSRIDEALRLWERANGTVVSEVEATPVSESTVADYRSEGPVKRAPAESVSPPAPPAAPRPLPATETDNEDRANRGDDELGARLVTGTPGTTSLEQYRRLAATLHEWHVESKLKTVMITSAVPREGKTLTVANLALTLSESYGRQVLLIDADLRAPSLHSVFNVPNGRGLSEALAHPDERIHCVAVTRTLSVLTAGRPGPTPLAALTSSRMAEVLEVCARHYDWVLIDTPPVGVLPDAQLLTRLVGGIILVIGAGSTPAAAVSRAVEEMGGPEAIIGTVLNRVEEGTIPEAGYYGHYREAPPRA
jgi:capsular exopolysaccharide synthesis family protein